MFKRNEARQGDRLHNFTSCQPLSQVSDNGKDTVDFAFISY